MTITTINIGNIANDGLGDDLRTAFAKVNANFQALNITASTTDVPGYSIFKEKVDNNLVFRTLQSGTNIAITETPDAITIASSAPIAFKKISTDNGSISASSFQDISIVGTNDITVASSASTITVGSTLPVTDILTTYDFGPITGDFTNAIQLLLANTSINFGTISVPSMFNLDCGTLG
jgi:hypothetical protein